MENIERIGICLELSDFDELMINYAAFIAEHSKAKDLYFIHVVKELDFSSALKKQFPNIEKEHLKEKQQALKEKIASHYPASSATKTHTIVKVGPIAKRILQIGNEKDLDLIVIGKRNESKNSGMLAQRLARRSNCSLLIIPANSRTNIERLLVPVDFSKNSERALQSAVDVAARDAKKVKIFAQNVYTVPTGYHYSGKSYDDFAKIMEDHARKDFKKFLKRIDTKGVEIEAIYSLDVNDDKTTDIIGLAKKLTVDAIFIGTRGLTASTALIIGSITERLIQNVKRFPLVIVRKKGENMGILDVIKGIK